MSQVSSFIICGVLLCETAVLLTGCSCSDVDSDVVVYTAHDQTFSASVMSGFSAHCKINVRAVYDTEAAKTVGLANRLGAEAQNPQCDVFWNNEVVRTIMLKRRGVLESYTSRNGRDIPAGMRDSNGYWTGFGARARVLICNTNLLKPTEYPSSILELTNAKWHSKVALAYPMFGTTATHAAALFAVLGDSEARNLYQQLKANAVIIADGNAAVKDMVARGEVPIGFTDTDDALIAVQQGKPVAVVFPDQGAGQMGTLVIPNTVALVKNCPHPEAGRKFIDFLLSREAEQMLAFSGSGQMPVREGIPVPPGVKTLAEIKAMPVDWERVADKTEEVAKFLSELFVR